MQFPGQAPVLGVIYVTTMSRADSVLALALLYGLQGKREARVAAVAVSGAGLNTAIFCDAVGRFYAGPGPVANSNRTLPVGLVADGPLSANSPMVDAVMAMRNDKGESPFPHSIERLSDTSEVSALIRNALTAQADGKAAILLSAPATQLATVLDLQGARELIVAKVKLLVLCDTGETIPGIASDPAATRKLLAAWPTPIVLCGPQVGIAIPYPASSIDTDFAWAPLHPVAEAVRASRKPPIGTPSWDMAAALYAVRPDAELFDLSGSGTIDVLEGGKLRFTEATGGKHRSLVVRESQKAKIMEVYKELASAKPAPPRQGGRPPSATQLEPPKPTVAKPPA